MAQASPFQPRPRLHHSLTHAERLSQQPLIRTSERPPFLLARAHTFSSSTYSPFRSAGLKPPTPYGGSVQFSPRPRPAGVLRKCGSYYLFCSKRLLTGRTILLAVIFLAFMTWWRNGWADESPIIRVGVSQFVLLNQSFEVDATKNLQFFPAANPKIHVSQCRVQNRVKLTDTEYVGRWTSTPNRLRKDGTFAGAYFDISVANTTSVLLSLYNHPDSAMASDLSELVPKTPMIPGHLSFRHSGIFDESAPPVSLLAQIDQDEYVALPNSSLLVSVRSNDLDPSVQHAIRVIVPLSGTGNNTAIQLEGIWLDHAGKLLQIKGLGLEEEFQDEDSFDAESTNIGLKHMFRLKAIMHSGRRNEIDVREESKNMSLAITSRRKVLEIVTDSLGSADGTNYGRRPSGADELLAGVMEWEYLLGEMFGVDHVTTAIDGMCLTRECIGGAGAPSGIGDVFFRSGPTYSPYFERPWMFSSYVPDVIILNLGSSDAESFSTFEEGYNQTTWQLLERFENQYISFIKAIRQLAYPKHPAVMHSEKVGTANLLALSVPASIPIFVMRPLRGQLEHATQGVVNKLRAEGDQGVFWLDTSGWLSEEVNPSLAPDYYYDDSIAPGKWRLTEQGNQRVAIFLHLHVCRFLAEAEDQCAFLPPDVYQGKVFDPESAVFDRTLEINKENKLKELFWKSGQPQKEGL